jgi:ketosteroid isomerase-like protein
MKSITNTLLLILLLFSFISCNNPRDETTVNPQQEKNAALEDGDFKSALKRINSILDTAILNGDYETLLKHHTDDVILMPNFRPAIKGKKELSELYKKDKKNRVIFHAFSGKPEKMWASGNEVYEYGTYGLAVTSKETEHPYAFYGSYFMIWEKQPNGTYLIKFSITNLDHELYEQ